LVSSKKKVAVGSAGAPGGIYQCAIVGRLDVDGQIFAPIGLHKTDAASDWSLTKLKFYLWISHRQILNMVHNFCQWHCIDTKGLPGVQN
jgi:hypothetical protein